MGSTRVKTPPPSKPQSAADGPQSILNRGRLVLEAEAAAIAEARELLGEAFVSAVQAIAQCTGRICVTGVGKAGLIGNKIHSTLASTGTLSYSLHPVEALHGDLGMIHADDVVIALSKSGSSELVELLPRLRSLGCSIILVTAKTDSPAAAHADHVLDIGRREEACPLGLAPSSSTAAMLAIGDALALAVMEVKAIQPEQYASYHPGGALGRLLMKTREIMRTGPNCPMVRDDATMASCHQTMLAAPMRSGAAGVVDGQGKLVGIITHGDFFRLFASPQPTGDAPVSSLMTRSPKCLSADAHVTEAIRIMQQHKIDELPIVDDAGKLVGLIDIQDLIAKGFTVVDDA